MHRSPNGDDPGEIETGDVVKREPLADATADPGEIEVVEVREGQREAPAGVGWAEEADPDDDPGELELENITGETGDREIGV